MTTPQFGDELAPAHPSEETLALLRLRRSTAADLLTEPGPEPAVLKSILEIAARAPDHRRVAPYRFIVFQGEARGKAGEILADAFAAQEPEADTARLEKERARFERAPVVIGVVSCVDREHRTPEWEQVMTVGAVCQNMLIAASAHGFAAQWLTEWYAYDQSVCSAFGLTQEERIAGYIYIGTARENPKERQRVELAQIVSEYK